MKIRSARYAWDGVHPLVILQMEDEAGGRLPDTWIGPGATQDLKRGNSVFLFGYHDQLPLIRQNGDELRSHTTEPEVIDLAKRFLADLENDNFRPGKVELEKHF